MINELSLIDNFSMIFERKIILYGAGDRGKIVAEILKDEGMSADYFCDSDDKKWGESICGAEVISPEKLKKLDGKENLVIVITPADLNVVEKIDDVLENMGLRTKIIVTEFGFRCALIRINEFIEIKKNLRQQFLYSTFTIQQIDNVLSRIKEVENIFVYQPGKVGSKTINLSLTVAKVPNCRAHMLIVNGRMGKNIDELLFSYQKALKEFRPLKVITLVREPITRELSHFFHRAGWQNDFLKCVISPGETLAESCAELIKDNCLGNSDFGYFSWFDHELKAVFDIDIFEHPFDKAKGYSVIKQNNIEVLVMKLEKLNSLESVIGDFVGAPHFKLVNTNEASSKPYKYLYQNVREVIKIPREVVDLYYKGNPRMDHFYTEEEKKEFLKKWQNNIAD